MVMNQTHIQKKKKKTCFHKQNAQFNNLPVSGKGINIEMSIQTSPPTTYIFF